MISLLFMGCCIFPRSWERNSSLKNIKENGDLDFEDASNTMAMDYAKWEDKLYEIYKKKLILFEIGLSFMGLSVLSEIAIFFVI